MALIQVHWAFFPDGPSGRWEFSKRKEETEVENTPELVTARLRLRRFTERDAPSLFQILRDRETNRFLPWFPYESLEQAQSHLWSYYIEYYQKPSGYRYAVCRRTDDLPIGYVHVSDGEGRDFGYGLRSDCWGQGIAAEAGRAVADRLM